MKKPISTEKNYPAFHRRIEIAFSNLPNVLVLVVVVLRYPIRVESTTSLVQKHFILFENNHKKGFTVMSRNLSRTELRAEVQAQCLRHFRNVRKSFRMLLRSSGSMSVINVGDKRMLDDRDRDPSCYFRLQHTMFLYVRVLFNGRLTNCGTFEYVSPRIFLMFKHLPKS